VRICLPELKHQRGEAVSYLFRGSVADMFGRDGFPVDGELEVALSASTGGEKVLIRGTLRGFLNVECSRCLRVFKQLLETEFQETFIIIPGAAGNDDPEQLAEAAANELSVMGNVLYLKEFLRQVFILAQEYKSLCRDDCKGLCKVCGADLNLHSCSCPTDSQVDLRLLKLKKLKR